MGNLPTHTTAAYGHRPSGRHLVSPIAAAAVTAAGLVSPASVTAGAAAAPTCPGRP